MRRIGPVVAASLAAALLAAVLPAAVPPAAALPAALPSVAGAEQELPREPLTAAAYLTIWDVAALLGLARPDPALLDVWVAITGDTETDARIREMAEARGYTRQPLVTAALVAVDGRRLQAPAAEAWSALKRAARADDITLTLTSAYRDLRDQRQVFLDRLVGRSEAGIAATLRFSAPPGFSRHQTGYTIDVGAPGTTRLGFADTAAYAWLAADDFAASRAHGWIPSYPEGGENMGPDPEAWEFAWVGVGRIGCASPDDHPTGFCDVAESAAVDDIAWLSDLGVTVGCRPGRFCPDDPITRGEAASLLWRLLGAPPAPGGSPFADVFATDPFSPAVDWLWAQGVVTGVTPDSFAPTRSLVAGDALALLVRLSTLDDLPERHGLFGPLPDFSAPPTAGGELGSFISRAEFASVLRRWVVEG